MKNIYEQPTAQIINFESERIMSDPGIGDTPDVSTGVEEW